MKYLSIMIKPSSSLCNMSCSYCFYLDEANNRKTKSCGFMDDKTIENIISKAFDFAEKSVSIVFQGGEPTLIGLDFYKRVIELEKKYNKNNIAVFNSIQTNGFSVSEEFAVFLHDNNFLVGVSLDGTGEIHDLNRRAKDGGNTFSAVNSTLRIFDKHKVEYNILTVVTRQTVRHIEKIYNYYKKCGYKFLQFIPCLNPIEKADVKYPYSLSEKDYGDFLIKLFDLWYADLLRREAPSIRFFDNIILILQGRMPELCSSTGVCSEQYVFEADGSVYPCDFYAFDDYCLGNINQSFFVDFDKKRTELNFIENSSFLNDECKACKYFQFCRCGCKRERNDENLNRFCGSFKRFYEYALPRLIQSGR